MNHSWLPKPIYPQIDESIHTEYLSRIYDFYARDFIFSKPNSPNFKYSIKVYPDQFGWPATFWHLISEGEPEANRQIRIERASKIVWIRPIIDLFFSIYPSGNFENILWWENIRNKKTRVLVSTLSFDYLVVLEKRKQKFLFCTAYPTRPRTAKRLEIEFNNFWD